MRPKPRPPEPHASRTSFRLLETRIDLLGRDEALRRAAALLAGHGTAHLVTANALLLLRAETDPALRAACDAADLVVPDSSGMSFAARVAGVRSPGRFPGIDLAKALCAEAARAEFGVYFLGAKPGVAGEAARRLAEEIPGLKIAGTRDGYFEDAAAPEIVGAIRTSKARLVLVALGMPRQEIFIHRHRADFPPGLAVGVGGSFDVWAGLVKRAPEPFQRLGLEWLYRVMREPWRLPRIAKLPLFAVKAAWSGWKNR